MNKMFLAVILMLTASILLYGFTIVSEMKETEFQFDNKN
jgi:hypothetical protein